MITEDAQGPSGDQHLYNTPSLSKPHRLPRFRQDRGPGGGTGLKALWLEAMASNRGPRYTRQPPLHLPPRTVSKIGGLECCPLPATLQLSNNFTARSRGCHTCSTSRPSRSPTITSPPLATSPTSRCPRSQCRPAEQPAEERDGWAVGGYGAAGSDAAAGEPVRTQGQELPSQAHLARRSLSYLDDRPVFEEERLTTDGAWRPAWRGGARGSARRKDAAHRRNLRYTADLMGHQPSSPPTVTSGGRSRRRRPGEAAAGPRRRAVAKRAAQDMLEEDDREGYVRPRARRGRKRRTSSSYRPKRPRRAHQGRERATNRTAEAPPQSQPTPGQLGAATSEQVVNEMCGRATYERRGEPGRLYWSPRWMGERPASSSGRAASATMRTSRQPRQVWASQKRRASPEADLDEPD